MRIRSAWVASGSLFLGLSSAAAAATLPFTGTLGFEVVVPGFRIGPVELNGSGVATVNGSGGGVHLNSLTIPAGAFLGNASVVVYNAAPISALKFAGGAFTFHLGNSFAYTVTTGSASNGAGSFAGLSNSANNLAGTMPLSGVALICFLGTCPGFPANNIVVPLSVVGQGGTATAAGVAGQKFTAIGAPWLKNTAAVGTRTIMGFAHGPASATQSTTAQPGGVLSLVTPVFVSTSLPAGFAVLATFSRVTLLFVPEPSTLLLLGSGVLALFALGRRRQ